MGDGQEVNPSRVRIAVIGAGLSGLCALRYFTQDPRFEVVAFEQRDRIGGLWSYPDGCEDHVDVDETSPYYCRLYRSLRLNGPALMQAFPEFPFLEGETVLESFPPRQVMTDYLQRYTETYDLTRYINFRTLTTKIQPVVDGATSSVMSHIGPRWSVTVRSLDKTGENDTTEIFDVVLVCNGHYNKLNIPLIDTIEHFEGQVIHSSAYRTPDSFRDKNVLLIGSSSSANDLTCELMHHAKTVLINRRGKYVNVFKDQARFPNIVTVPPTSALRFSAHHLMIQHHSVEEDIAHEEEYALDAVILCTGFTDQMLFLSSECHMEVNRGRVSPLYNHLIHCKYPTLCCVGVPRLTEVPKLVEYQVRYYKAVLEGMVTLPSREDMKKECEADERERRSEGLKEHQRHLMYPVQARYFAYLRNLAAQAGFQPNEPVDEKMFLHVLDTVINEPYDFRRYRYARLNSEEFFCEWS